MDKDELEVGQIALGRAWTRCDQSLETVYVDTLGSFFGGERPIATFSHAALAERFVDMWNAGLPDTGYIVVCDCCFQAEGHDGRFACFSIPQLAADLDNGGARETDHVCGLQGYDPMRDPPCPGCKAMGSGHAMIDAAFRQGDPQ